MNLDQLETPCLLLDRTRMQRNLAAMATRIGAMGANLRPHVKTHKSVDVLRDVVAAGHVRGITVSTLAEAEHFHAAGVTDILYAVGITAPKLDRVAALMAQGCDLRIILDSIAMAQVVVARGEALGCCFSVLIELDVDGHRSGVQPASPLLLDIATVLQNSPGAQLVGVMTHAGDSYGCTSAASLRAMAAQERDLSLLAATRLRAAGHDCPVVSIGSTPTARNVDHLVGITEVRVGVYTFFDLVQAGLGVCDVDDVALSVLATVIGLQPEKGTVITDAGWMAVSRDRGTQDQPVDQGYGLVCCRDGVPLGDVIVASANQEHGVLSRRDGSMPELAIGDLVRILPNHACAMAAQHSRYHVVEGNDVIAQWPRANGW
jgi:D-serine deaminase-like pyridoxal phosphate-dependent protein